VKERKSAGNVTEIEEKSFIVVRKEADSLPDDPARKHTNSASVVLAFPIDEDDAPIVDENQYVYAYLPLRQVGFSVRIIHCRMNKTRAYTMSSF